MQGESPPVRFVDVPDGFTYAWRVQWGATLTWSAELPLPLPLQFDEVADGCRLGFVTVRDGAVCLVRWVDMSFLQSEQCISSIFGRGCQWLPPGLRHLIAPSAW